MVVLLDVEVVNPAMQKRRESQDNCLLDSIASVPMEDESVGSL